MEAGEETIHRFYSASSVIDRRRSCGNSRPKSIRTKFWELLEHSSGVAQLENGEPETFHRSRTSLSRVLAFDAARKPPKDNSQTNIDRRRT